MELKQLIKEAHENAKSKGFYDNEMCALAAATDQHRERILDAFQMQKLMLIVSELGEACEAHRKGRLTDLRLFDKNMRFFSFEDSFNDLIKGTFEEELADAAIRLFDFCGAYNINLEKLISIKMKMNSTREHKHGKNY